MKRESVEINKKKYYYSIIKKKGLKRLRIKISGDGKMEVFLPWFLPKSAAQNFLLQKANWIEKNFNLLNKKINDYFYLGTKTKIVEKINSDYLSIYYYFQNNIFYILHNGKTKVSKHLVYHAWLRTEAKKYITKETERIASENGFTYNKISIKDMTSRWGSCSAKKNLSFNLKLMYFKPKIIEYVIVHELCHLKEMNHSKNFWLLVENIIPNYKIYRKQLKNFQLN